MIGTNIASVSVIIPCFCCSETIEKTIESVLNQTLLPKEIIIINDGSRDAGKTKEKLDAIKNNIYINFKKIILINIDLKKNYGPSYARNKGWNLSTQNYIAFLDSDDLWDKNKIKLQYNWMENHKEVCFTGHKSDYNLNFTKNNIRFFNFKNITINQLLFKNYFPTRTVMIKRKVNFRFDENKRFGEDFDLWLRISEKYALIFLDIILSYSLRPDFSKGGLSNKLLKMQKSEVNTMFLVYNKKKISLITFIIALIYSNLKFFRRILICLFRY